ncbi:hypothetical protein ASD79_08390 [Caulobacter sp. Root655]|uniref:DUF2155 domain-containing protein n=1 Tax=Caulobacter sp. Root655 TaxID=1736578 RepID=UPI0006FDB4FF|nr:DUF2155 domain-containing protein [Caulobacter sp. Root655]KRA60246.1 hypothetical protein ASD79_08390 [Caulobacter sp. Root655]
MTIRRSLTGVATLALAASLAGGGAWALQNTPQQPPAAQTPPPAQPAPIVVPAQSRPVPGPQVAPTAVQPTPAPTTAAPAPAPTPAQPAAKPAATPAAKPTEQVKRARSSVAIIQALDKVTTETMKFEAPVGQPIRYKTLVFTVRACETTAPDEDAPDSVAYVTVDTQPKALPGRVAPPGRQIYKGWMYANAPGLNPLQHPVYDAWLIACKTSAPAAPAASR